VALQLHLCFACLHCRTVQQPALVLLLATRQPHHQLLPLRCRDRCCMEHSQAAQLLHLYVLLMYDKALLPQTAVRQQLQRQQRQQHHKAQTPQLHPMLLQAAMLHCRHPCCVRMLCQAPC
jgi:hypothetical protein